MSANPESSRHPRTALRQRGLARLLAAIPEAALRLCLWLVTHAFYRICVTGREILPKQGPALLVSNYLSFTDSLLIRFVSRRSIRFLIARVSREVPLLGRFGVLTGALRIAETDSPREMIRSLRRARACLRSGELVAISAEGVSIAKGYVLPFRRAFEHITRGLDVQIVPIHLDSVGGSVRNYEGDRFVLKWPKRTARSVTITIGRSLPAHTGAFAARQAVMELGAEAFSRRDAVERPLPEMFLNSCRRHWSRLLMADTSGREITFGKALAGALLFRRLIRDRCPGEQNIGILLPPSVAAALVNYGISLAGRIPVNLNYTTSATALAFAIERAGLSTIITSSKLLERVPLEPLPGMVMIEDLANSIPKGRKVACALAARLLPRFLLRRWILPAGTRLDSLATIVFSSGSTGAAKGVMLSHRNIVSNIEACAQALGVTRRDGLLGILPFFHAFGFTVGLWLPPVAGFRVAFHSNPLEARRIGELCRQYSLSILVSTPTFAWDYARRCSREDFASLRVAIVGAEKMKPALALAFKERFGLTLDQGYGCTELSPVVSTETPGFIAPAFGRPARKHGTVGRPIPGVAVRVVDGQTFRDLEPGHKGMLLVKSPGVMMGYLGDPELTQAVIRDGWYITGDIASLDEDGFITVTDRLARFSKIGGEMVPHLHIEEALEKALDSDEPRLVVTAIPDEHKGERIVVLHTELGLPVDDLVHRLRESGLPHLWMPRRESFFQVPALPVMGSGKLDLRLARNLACQLAARIVTSGK